MLVCLCEFKVCVCGVFVCKCVSVCVGEREQERRESAASDSMLYDALKWK